MTIKVVKFVTGEELIGEIHSSESGAFILLNVAVVSLVPTPTGGIGISLFPFAPYAEKSEFKFTYDKTLTIFEPGRDLLNNYNRLFGSGLVIADNSNVPPPKGKPNLTLVKG